MSEVKKDLEAVSKTLDIVKRASIVAADAPLVAAVIDFLGRVEASIAQLAQQEETNAKAKDESLNDAAKRVGKRKKN